MAIVCNGITFPGVIREPVYDAITNDAIVGASGIFYGCTLSKNGSNRINVTAGFGIIKGRLFNLDKTNGLTVTSPSGTGTRYGIVYMELNTTNTSGPIQIKATDPDNYASSLASAREALLTNENINFAGGSAHQVELGYFTISSTGIASVVQTAGGKEDKLLNRSIITELIQYKTDTTWHVDKCDPVAEGSYVSARGRQNVFYNEQIAIYHIAISYNFEINGSGSNPISFLWTPVPQESNNMINNNTALPYYINGVLSGFVALGTKPADGGYKVFALGRIPANAVVVGTLIIPRG